MRSAMIRRMRLRGRGASSPSAAGAEAAAAGVSGDAGASGADGSRAASAAWMSRSTIRPSGPVPVRWRGSTPAPAASRLARGLIRSPLSAEGASPRVGTAADSGCGTAAGASAASLAGPGGGASGISSPGWPTYATTEFTGTVSPSSTSRRKRTPASKASTSITALSVSISNSTSPLATGSPSALFQVRSVHSSVIWPGRGIRIGRTIGLGS
jgi:hypothetical protein